MTYQHRPRNPGFLDLPAEMRDPNDSRFAVLPVPYDETSSWQKGADRGPAAIIDASATVEWYDIQTNSEPCRRGITTLPPIDWKGSPEELADRVAVAVDAIFDREQMPVLLGGEHSVSIGAIRAAAKRIRNLSVLQIDAHGDTREEYEGSSHNHACIMARARQWCPIVQVGLRAIEAAEVDTLERDRVFFAHEIVQNVDASWMDRAIDLLTDDVYITIDLDAFDPSLIPATGTPEPGGLSWSDVDRFLQRVTARRRVAAFDVVELLPMPGHHASAFTAAKLVYRLIAMIVAREPT